MAQQVADAFVKLVIDEKDLQRAVASQTGPAARAATGVGTTVASRFGSAFVKGTTAAGAAAGAIFTGAIGGAVNFEDQLRTINTVAHLTDGELKGVGDSILDLSRETGKSTDDLTAGFYDLVSAGVPASKAIDVLRASAKFATGALGTTGEAVDLVTSAMNAYGLKAEDATRITDVFAQAVNDGKVTAAELGASIANIAPIAASAGIKIEEVSAGFALLTAKGVPAAQAATQMRAAIAGLLTPNEQLNKIQAQTGINFAELAKAKGLAVALEELRKATGGNADEFARALGSVEAYQFALASTGDNTEAFASELGKTTDALNNGGVAQAQYDERMKSAKAQGDKLLATIKGLAIEIGGPFTEVLGPAISLLGQLGTAGLFLTSTGLGGLLGRVFGGAWLKLAGSGPVKAIISRAGSAAATAYLAALIKGDSISEALAAGWSKVTGSSAVKGATSRAGDFLGSTLGKAASVAFAAVLVFEAIDTYNRIKGELAAQGREIGNAVGNEIAVGTIEDLEKSKGALQQGIADLANIGDFGLFTGDSRRNLEKQLADVNAELQRRARSDPGWAAAGADVTDHYAGGITAATPKAATAITNLVGEMRDDLDRAGFKQEAHRQGNLAGAGIAQGIIEKRSVVDQSWQALLDALKNAQTPTAERARLIGQLASKELAKGLRSGDPAVRAQAQATKQTIIDRLNELGASTRNIGKKGMDELKKAMRSKDPDIRAAATLIYNSAKKPIAKLPARGTEAGSGMTANIRHQIDAGKGPVGAAASRLARTIFQRLLGTMSASFASEVDVRHQHRASGGPAIAGTPYIINEMTPRSEVFIPGRSGYVLTRSQAEAALTRGLSDVTGGGGTTNVFNVAVAGLVRARDSLELAREMRRVSSFSTSIAKTRPSFTTADAA